MTREEKKAERAEKKALKEQEALKRAEKKANEAPEAKEEQKLVPKEAKEEKADKQALKAPTGKVSSYKVLSGKHIDDKGKLYTVDEIVKSKQELDKVFKNKFKKV
jgi:hypothetical protein